jgi:hypothetical protein
MTIIAFADRHDDMPLSDKDIAAISAKAGASAGAPAELLDGYLQVLIEVSLGGRRLREEELRRWRDIGARAAERGVAMRAMIKTIIAVHIRCRVQRPAHGPGGALNHCRPGGGGDQMQQPIRVCRVHVDGNIARYCGDEFDADFRRAQRQHESKRVIHTWIGVDSQ